LVAVPPRVVAVEIVKPARRRADTAALRRELLADVHPARDRIAARARRTTEARHAVAIRARAVAALLRARILDLSRLAPAGEELLRQRVTGRIVPALEMEAVLDLRAVDVDGDLLLVAARRRDDEGDACEDEGSCEGTGDPRGERHAGSFTASFDGR